MSHTCHAIGCKANCKPKYLMCPAHWKMVPKSRQDRVYEEYQRGQENGDSIPTPQWHSAADVAIYYVHILELRTKVTELRTEKKQMEEMINKQR